MENSAENQEIEDEPRRQRVPCSTVAASQACGYSWWKPACLRRLARPWVFLLVMCLFVGSDGLNVGIITGTLTSVEARFQFTLTEIGSMQTGYCVGGIVGLILSMYFGGRAGSNKPRLLGICGMLCGLGMASQSLPQFMYPPYQPLGVAHHSGNLTTASNTSSLTCASPTTGKVCDGDSPLNGESFNNRAAYWVFVFGAVIQGMSIMGVYPVGMAYIADCTSQGTTSLYIGIVNAILGLGPVAGVMLAASVIGIWVDFYRVEDETQFGSLGPGDPGWIGAWWLGYLVVAALFVLSASQFLLFPQRMTTSSSVEKPANYQEMGKMTEAGEDCDHSTGFGTNDHRFSSAKDFLLAVWRTLKNPYCSLTCLSQSTFYFIMYGYGVFVPKYMEVQFGYDRQMADLLTGVLLAPAYAFGELFAGFLVKKLELRLHSIIRLTCGVLTACMVGMALLIIIGCGNDRVVGVFTGYTGDNSHTVELEAPCNTNCSCSVAVYLPVCAEDTFTYFSPCHAGCKEIGANGEFTECSCLTASSANESLSTSTVEGACGTGCKAAVPFLVVLTAVFILATFSDLLRLTIIVRSATKENRLVALCLTYLTQVAGIVPAGLVFGSLIDSTCLQWQQTCHGQGACLLYDNNAYRHAYNGLALGVAALSAGAMYIVVLLPKDKFNSLKEVGDIVA